MNRRKTMSLKKSDYAFRADKGLRTIIKQQKDELTKFVNEYLEPCQNCAKLQAENELLVNARNNFQREIGRQKAEIAELQARNDTLHEDYDALVQIISEQGKEKDK
jgi:peptidoglycan hydrolase CwlO-like protein